MFRRIKPYLNFRYFLYFFSFVAGWPCVFYLMGWLPHYTVNYLLLFALASFFVLLKNEYRVPRPIAMLLVLQTAAWGIYSVIHGLDTSYFTRILMLCITYMFLEMQMSGEHDGFIKTYNTWLVFQAVAGTIGFLLVVAGILQPIFEFREMDGRPGFFFGLFATNTYFDGLVRNAGFYDEPGALAFWGMYALIINKLFIDNKKVEVLLIAGLISTLSLAYFIQIALYAFFFYKEQWRKLLPYIAAFVLALVLISSFNSRMDKAIFGRMEYDEETGTFSGDNRSKMTKVCWDIFLESPIVGQGARHLIEISGKRRVFVGANPNFTLACDGVVGQLVYWSPFLFLFWLKRYDKKYGWAFWILIVGFLQRPYEGTQLLYPLLSFSIVMHAYNSRNSDSDMICTDKQNRAIAHR